ncbi:MAG: T9SS type A sorting domain-containing protein [Saprospiraceae bacterium]|nr:T9SS type A sorting domain-containing protein [Saprospiraceae bacterium]MCF8252081.1 T9SS type A sorting domain-containing protein [Saprospiraceae bacterium]MCF8281787.1 T9SS type A sorting domain-containing protein [Bacteroidales bacterium]MCF8313724.1 T9SS type A sorting domain-containing protein [Saprospiraceae bacterium]MCF8442431.1 T9SS type A sorting domain-containing protein [Saprospiraceae bacterium]
MKNINQHLILPVLFLLLTGSLHSQNTSPNCAAVSDENYFTGEVFFNYGSMSNAFNSITRTSFTVGQPLVGTNFGQDFTGGFGFWTRFLLPPNAPVVTASEGDLEDRVQVDWRPDPLSPPASGGFNIYRNEALLAHVDPDTRSFIDFNVLAGKFYTYEVAGVNNFGEGYKGAVLGFLNPNGVVTGQVKTFSGNPVPGASVTLSPTIGRAIEFDGNSMLFTPYVPSLSPSQFTVSCWVKLGDGNDDSGILDLGSSIGKNWWLHTTGAGTKGVAFSMGNGVGSTTTLSHEFAAATANDWHYVAATYNGASLLLYVDGELITTAVGSMQTDAMTFFMGRRGDGLGNLTGKIDEVRVYDRQLAQTELQMFMNRTVPANAEGLQVYWKFDEGVGSKGFDQTANKTKSYLCGAAWTSDKPNVVNAGITNETGFYEIAGINYGGGTTFTATPSKNFYFNQSLEFNGVNQTYADLTDFDLPDTSSVTVTVKAFDFSGNQAILSKSNGTDNVFVLCLNNGNLDLIAGGTTHTFGALGMGFHYLALTMLQNGGSLETTLYVDGTLAGSHTFAGMPADWSGLPWKLGAKADGGGHTGYLTGLVDEAAFFNALLPLSDIQAFANIGTNASHIALTNYFNLNEGQGTELHDMGTSLSGNGTTHGTGWSTEADVSQVLPHEFLPSSRLLTLNPSSTSVDQLDFTDQSTIPVSGYVRFDGTSCYQRKVEILVNGVSHSPAIYTNVDGKFTADFEPGKDVVLTPKFENHTFYPAFWELPSLSTPVAGILFRNQTTRSVSGQVAGGFCRKSIIPTGAIVKVKVATLNGCYEQVQELTGNGKFVFNGVPPDSVTVAIIEHSNPVIYTYFQNLGGATLDLRFQSDSTDFIYFAPPVVEMTQLDTNLCGYPMLSQAGSYKTTIKVYEQYDGGKCYLDTALLTINNVIADLDQFDTLMTEGTLVHRFKAGGPNIVSPYEKILQVTAEAHDEQATIDQSAVVLGKRARQTTFATTAPEIPSLILRDPPGDGSYAYMEAGATNCQTWSFSAGIGATFEESATVSLAPDFTTSVGVGAEVEVEVDNTSDLGFEMSLGFNLLTTNESETCITTTQVISTGDNDVVVGSGMGGDVFMGGAMNYIFGITDELKFDTSMCDFFLDKGLTVFPKGFATTFVYSEKHINSVVIPNLITIGDLASAQRWEEIIAYNNQLKSAAVFEKNISFDAGITYEQSSTTETSESFNFEATLDVSAAFSSAFGVTANGVGVVGGIKIGLSTSVSTAVGNSENRSRTVGYVFSDDDIYDNFSVNVKKDQVYGTPVFDLVSGQSSCPHEPNTQPREEVSIVSDKLVAVNVGENDAAIFNLTLGNIAPSGDIGFYTLELVPESNQFGALVTVNGDALAAPLGYQVNANEGLDIQIAVFRGAAEYSYENLRLAWYSSCEFNHAAALGIPRSGIDPKFYKELEFDVHFLEPCSSIDIGFPLQDWVLTPAGGNILNITTNSYDISDPDLELIRVQYRRTQGDGAWINIAEIQKADLGPVFTITGWDTQGLQDGLYEIRAVTQCFSGALNPGISHVIKGKIERTAPEIFGTPEPADGVLNAGDEISITFTEPIRCDLLIQADFFDNNNVGLYDTQTGDLVDAIVTCNGDKIVIVPNVPNQYIENRILRVEIDNIQDLAGNTFVHAQWEFFVDRNPLRWQASEIEDFKYEDQFKAVYKTIVNTGGNAEFYNITGVPTWVEVYPKTGILAPGQQQAITFEFDSSMVIGAFVDTIFMEGALGDEPLPIDFRNLCRSPQWEVNPAAWTYSMNFTVELDIEGDLSEDKQDIVAAFVDGELRGKAYIQHVPGVNTFEAFLTVYSNDFTGGTVTFQIWDASECLLYGEVLESYTFTSDELVGTPNVPVTLHTNNLLLRKIALKSGWNWISFNLGFPDPALNAALSSLDHPQNDLMKDQTSFASFSAAPVNSWIGSLANLGNTSMYQYRADVPDTISLLGNPIDVEATDIPVVAGWNWISYLPQNPQLVNDALSSLTPLNGDVIKNQTAFAQFVAGFGWLGNLQYMQAPEGYLLKMANPGTLTYPANFTGTIPLEDRNAGGVNFSPWMVNPAQFEHTMIMVGMLAENGENVTKEGMTLGAFANGEVRGVSPAIYVEPLDEWLFFLTAYSNGSGEPLQFKLHDEATGEISDLQEGTLFTIDGQEGSVEAPMPLTLPVNASTESFASPNRLLVQPNPFNQSTTIRFKTVIAGEISITVIDAFGRLAEYFKLDATSGWNSIKWDAAGLPSGVYFVKVETAGATLTEKVVLER